MRPIFQQPARQYFLLLLDLVLVIIYLSIVQQTDNLEKGPVSAAPEASRLAIMYGLYAFWDFCHDIWGKTKQASIGQVLCAIFLRCGASLLCAAVSVLILWRAAWPGADVRWHVCLLNAAEITNIVLFRALKVGEWPLQGWMASRHWLADGQLEKEDRYPGWRVRMKCASFFCVTVLLVIAGVFVGVSASC